MQSYFTLFELPASFDLDLSALEKAYFTAQRRFHPDRLVGKSAAERQQAITQSMLVNEAYEALKNPLRRAQHLLRLQGITTESAKPSQGLLMEIMELREALGDAPDAGALETLGERAHAATQATLTALLRAFADSDMAEAMELTMRLSYLIKLQDEIRVRAKVIA